MKFGVRKPNIKKSIKARTTGRIKRSIKRAINPLYGKKGTGWIKNPKRAVYNKVYNKTSVSAGSFLKLSNNWFLNIFIIPCVLIYNCYKYLFLMIVWLVRKIINLFNKN